MDIFFILTGYRGADAGRPIWQFNPNGHYSRDALNTIARSLNIATGNKNKTKSDLIKEIMNKLDKWKTEKMKRKKKRKKSLIQMLMSQTGRS